MPAPRRAAGRQQQVAPPADRKGSSMSLHHFHIPVMGIGFSIDTPLAVAPLGIDSTVSLADDELIEQVREALCSRLGRAYEAVRRRDEDCRARRISAYLDLLHELVQAKFDEIRRQPFFQRNDKQRYFELLPDASALREGYERLLALRGQPGCETRQAELSSRMQPGSIDVNIMVKLDRTHYDAAGEPLPAEHNDAHAALRGFARSQVQAAVVFSAGINKRLFRYLAQFREFYRDSSGDLRKRIVLKVSDFRSALSQGRFLAKLGLEVSEYRVESGLNCGGHAFGSAGRLLPGLLAEFREGRERLRAELRPLVESFYRERGEEPPVERLCESRLTVQGGVGTAGEARRLREDFGVDSVGWGSPFLLVPETTRVDAATRRQLAAAGPDDLYLSLASPLGIAFNNLRGSSSETWTEARADSERPGSPCPKGMLVSDTEFGPRPLCTASTAWQSRKRPEIEATEDPERRASFRAKACLCAHLGNGALIDLGLAAPDKPVAVCPGPNIAWFTRECSLEEMVDHIYGRGCLTPAERPHVYAAELRLNVDELEREAAVDDGSDSARRRVEERLANLRDGLRDLAAVAAGPMREGENGPSLLEALAVQGRRIDAVEEAWQTRDAAREAVIRHAAAGC
jgi:hypothetical protein